MQHIATLPKPIQWHDKVLEGAVLNAAILKRITPKNISDNKEPLENR